MSNIAVIGLGFGDEGKGNIVNYLCSQYPKPIVIRHNGGHQAGHTVIHNGVRHVFSNFGSGTLQGVPTYWSKFCTVDPIGIINEMAVLIEKGIHKFQLIIDPEAMVTTPYDIQINLLKESVRKHGTVGVGFGETILRNERGFKLYFRDLFFPKVLRRKLDAIRAYAIDHGGHDLPLDRFMECVDKIKDNLRIFCHKPNLYEYETRIFEGAQGLMLDQDYGFFPHVTRSKTGTKNIRRIIRPLHEIFYVTRTYQTRHGNGPMTGKSIKVDNPDETNQDDGHQGEFRTGKLDVDLLSYALACDSLDAGNATKNLVVTCWDQRSIHVPIQVLHDDLNTDNLFLCDSPECKELKLI
jgi:adenylosuccinate synthase